MTIRAMNVGEEKSRFGGIDLSLQISGFLAYVLRLTLAEPAFACDKPVTWL